MPLKRTNSTDPVRRVPITNAVQGSSYRFQLDYEAEKALSSVKLACKPAWIEVSLDGGSSWTPLGTDPRTGVEIGPMTQGERKTLDFRVNVPSTPAMRRGVVAFLVGEEE